jgi:hypothetical protein
MHGWLEKHGIDIMAYKSVCGRVSCFTQREDAMWT